MPPRWLTLAILGFWLFAMVWLTVREIAPRWRVGEPPPYTIDLTDEVSGQEIYWRVLQKGEKIGRAKSWVKRLADRTYELNSHLEPVKLVPFESVELKNTYQVNSQGELLAFKVEGKIELPFAGRLEGDIVGKVEEGFLTPELRGRFLGHEQVFRGERAKVPGSVLNSMHLLSKIAGLADGQRWSVPLIDPLQFFSLAPARSIPRLDAVVSTAPLDWDGQQRDCFLIEYREPGNDKVAAKTWVRRSDGIVLKHAATHDVMELVLEREPTR
jgi:hypothetical protein